MEGRRTVKGTSYSEVSRSAEMLSMTRIVLDSIGVSRTGRIRDVGCGTGVVGGLLRDEYCHTGELACIDPDEGMLEACRQRLSGASIHAATAETIDTIGLPLQDAIIAANCIHLFHDLAKSLSNFATVTMPGSMLCFSTPYFLPSKGGEYQGLARQALYHAYRIMRSRNLEYRHGVGKSTTISRHVDAEELSRSLSAAGFAEDKIFYKDLELTMSTLRKAVSTEIFASGVFPNLDASVASGILSEAFERTRTALGYRSDRTVTRSWLFGVYRRV